MPLIQRHFLSWHQFVTCVDDDKLFAHKSTRSSHIKSSDKWHGTKDWDQCISMALNSGWPEGRDLLSHALAIVSPRPEPYKSISYDVAGAMPSIPMYLTGDPACMMNFDTDHTQANPVVRLDYCNGGLAEIDPLSLMLRGAAVLSLAATLEQKGYSTEIRLVVNTKFNQYSLNSYHLETTIIIKQAGEQIDLDRLAFSLAHPAVHRRLRFALIEQHEELGNDKGSTYQFSPDIVPDGVIHIIGPHLRETPASARLAVELAAKQYLEERQ